MAPVNISINDVSLPEGNSGNKNFVFTVTRSGDTKGASSVDYATTSATATSSVDYITTSLSTVKFAANEAKKTVTIVVKGDSSIEPNETFSVNLLNCIGCTITDSKGVGTIQNDDLPSVDSDSDGVPDSADKCPSQSGPKTNNGCPATSVAGGGQGNDLGSFLFSGGFGSPSWVLPAIIAIIATGVVLYLRDRISLKFVRR
jgi:serralysin